MGQKEREMRELSTKRGIEIEVVKDIGKGMIERITWWTQPSGQTEGILILEQGAEIFRHGHPKNIIEIYTVLEGNVSVNGEILQAGDSRTCDFGEEHDLKNLSADETAVVQFRKFVV